MNYLSVNSHDLFDTILGLMEEVEMTPADIAENLMLKSGANNAKNLLKNLIKALETAKVEVRNESKEETKREKSVKVG